MQELLTNHPAFSGDNEEFQLQDYKKVLYIVRHGETDYNRSGVVQGRGVNTDLNDLGHEQAQKFFKNYKHIAFDKVYTSTLKRTHQTMRPFISTGLAWEQHPGFDELDWGENEGKPYKSEVIDGFTTVTNAWLEGKYDKRFIGGESPLDVSERQMQAMEYVMGKEDERNILICMHGRAMRILLCGLLNIEFRNMDRFIHQNTSLYTLGYTGQQFNLLTFNSLAHLEQIEK
ncbi:histidine phosphatase family protein [Solitalea lacus]|uniref:histidine phosphatase family protein n=1 Tax=Solitalea lacus TaxID=2911172 RepID=UPI001EDA5599|nr:histidine phosphatase family protein [Solitalea lacus]UKJ06085.1 histidine phosphatase family protein [Solitalea lacus]